jgi:hypothetical protein
MPSIFVDLSTIAAVGSFAAAVWIAMFARRQVRGAEEQAEAARRQVYAATVANSRAERSAQIELIIHFAESYHRVRGVRLDFSNPAQIEQFWGLLYLEFFYFDQCDVPESIYGLWMVELAALYSDESDAWASHETYLQRFSGSFARMYEFFRGISEISVRDKNMLPVRDKAVLDWVRDWSVSHPADGTPRQREP